MTTQTNVPVLVSMRTFTSPLGDFREGDRVRANHPVVEAYPEFFIDALAPRDEWHTDIDAHIDLVTQREAEARDRARQEWEAACRSNPQKLDVEVLVFRKDSMCDVAGVPTLILKGSRVLSTDPIVREHPGWAYKSG